MLAALKISLGIVSTACAKVGINRTTYYTWLKKDKSFAAKVSEIEEEALDFAESSLLCQIEAGNTTATIFYLKTKGKKRGYV